MLSILRRALCLCLLFIGLAVPAHAQDEAALPPAVWDGARPFTVLVMGVDRRPGDVDVRYLNDVRADTLLLIRFDPQAGRLGVLSIARDLFFALPDTGELVRVNTLLVLGEQRQAGSGPRFMVETVQANLGLYIDAYAVFDFEAFITLVDAIGGVEIDVPYTIYDAEFPDMNYRYDPLYLRPGLQTLDGYDALRYARTRHQDSDYQRGTRQLQVLAAVRQKLMQPETAQNLIAQSPALLAALNGHFYTNIPVDLAITLAGQVALLDADALVTGALDQTNTYAYEGMRIPDRTQLAAVLTAVFGAGYNL